MSLEQKMDLMFEEIKGMRSDVKRLEVRMDALDTRIEDLEAGMDKLDASMNDMKAKQDMFGNVLERLATKISLLHEQERANRFFIELQLERKFSILDQDLAAVMDVFLWLKNKTMEKAA